MEGNDLIFSVVFVFSIFFLLYSLGISVTGHVAQFDIETVSDTPAPAKGSIAIYSILFVLVMIVGIIYFSKRRRYFG